MIRPNRYETPNLELYQILMTHKRPMMWAFSCVMLVAIAVTFLSPKTYTSEAKLFVRLGRESLALDPTATTGQMALVHEPRESEINSVFELVKSRAILSNVVETVGPEVVLGTDSAVDRPQTANMVSQFNLFRPYSISDDALKYLSDNLTVVAIKKSNVINVSYEARTPELARQIVTRIIDQARDAHMRVNRTYGSHDFFTTQVDQFRGKVERLETTLRDLKNRTGVISPTEQRVLKVQQIGDLQTTLLRAEANLNGSAAEMQVQLATLEKIPQTVQTEETHNMPHSPVAAMREQLFALQVHEKELLSKFTESHPLSVLVRDQVSTLKKVIDNEAAEPQVTHAPNPAHREIHLAYLRGESSAASLQTHFSTLRGQLGAAREELTDINNHEVEIARLEREIAMETANYKKYSENLEQARIDHELQQRSISNLNLLQSPTYSITPTRPKHVLNLTLGLMGGLASSLMVGLFLEQRRGGLFNRSRRGRRSNRFDLPTAMTNGRFAHNGAEALQDHGVGVTDAAAAP
jgi:uncharacterized protein involved in exopolysaccharide biosynthesis